MRKHFYSFLILAIFIATFWKSRDILLERIYDLGHGQEKVTKKEELSKIIRSFDFESYRNLKEDYKEYTSSNKKPYDAMLAERKFARIGRKDLNKRIVGNHRLKEFVTKDKYYWLLLYSKKRRINFILNKTLLEKFILLEQRMIEEGLNPEAIRVTNGHRTPRKNKTVGGASQSRHIVGEAVDITIGDINRDGKYTDLDKQLVLDLLEYEIIKDSGGIGRYPGSRSIHFDTRGYRARWDKQ